MKRLLFSALFFAVTVIANAQTFAIKNVPSTSEDYKLLLEAKGYKSFAFDVTSLKDDTYWIEPVIQHYKNGLLVKNDFEFSIQFSNRDMLATDDKDYVQQMRQSGMIYDEENGILSLCEKLRVGFIPSDNQLVRIMQFYVTERGTFTMPLMFETQTDPNMGEEYNNYGFRQFLVNEIVLDKFIPLAMCGTYWYDEEIQRYRFCGDDILTDDMTSSLLTDVKEYYIIGMKVHK